MVFLVLPQVGAANLLRATTSGSSAAVAEAYVYLSSRSCTNAVSQAVVYLLPHSCSNDVLNQWSFLFFRRLVRQTFWELQLQDLQLLLERLMFTCNHDHAFLRIIDMFLSPCSCDWGCQLWHANRDPTSDRGLCWNLSLSINVALIFTLPSCVPLAMARTRTVVMLLTMMWNLSDGRWCQNMAN